jgi:hypothetical protein
MKPARNLVAWWRVLDIMQPDKIAQAFVTPHVQ